MEPLAVMIPESPHGAAGPHSGFCSPAQPRAGSSIPRDVLLWARPQKNGDVLGLSARKIQSIDELTAEGALRNLDGETPTREALLAIRSALGVNRTPGGEEVQERTALVCPLQVRFSQLVAKPYFKESEMEVKDVVSQISLKKHEKGDILDCPFAPIRCIWWKPRDGDEAAWFSLDNRRLVALQKRALLSDNPHRCLAEVIVLDRLPDPALVRERGFHGEGFGIDILGEEWWDWRAAGSAKHSKNESSDEGSTDSGDEAGSTTGESSSDGCAADSPSLVSSTAASPVKSATLRLSLEAALYNSTSPGGHSIADDLVPPAPWWWPAPQFDAPEVEDPPKEEAESMPGCDVQTTSSSPPGLKAPPGLEHALDVPKSDFPVALSAPPSFDATCIELVSSNTAETDGLPPPPKWSAVIPAEKVQSPAAGCPPAWWPATEDPQADTTPPPPTWWASSDTDALEGKDSTEKKLDAGSAFSSPPTSSCPPNPEGVEVRDMTPPPPNYDAPGFDAPGFDAPGFDAPGLEASCATSPPSLPPNVAAPPKEPPKFVVSLEDLTDSKAPPSSPPKDLPKLTVSLEDLTTPKAAPGTVPSRMTPPAYVAPGFTPPYFSGYPTPYSGGHFASPAGGRSNWGRF